MKNIGIFSGTFDPIHDGHILFAQTAMGEFGLDGVVFVPEQSPRYKEFASDITYRAAMIERAISEYDYFHLMLSASEQHGLDVLDEVQQNYDSDNLFLLIGSDVLDHIGEWHDIDSISDRVKFVVANRGGEQQDLEDKADIAQISYEILPTPASNISSSKIRQAVADGMVARGLDDNVQSFIEKHELYG